MRIADDTVKVAYAIIAMHGSRAAGLADANARSLRMGGDPYAALAWTHIAFAARQLLRGQS